MAASTFSGESPDMASTQCECSDVCFKKGYRDLDHAAAEKN
jgi:hypothetical protein